MDGLRELRRRVVTFLASRQLEQRDDGLQRLSCSDDLLLRLEQVTLDLLHAVRVRIRVRVRVRVRFGFGLG